MGKEYCTKTTISHFSNRSYIYYEAVAEVHLNRCPQGVHCAIGLFMAY